MIPETATKTEARNESDRGGGEVLIRAEGVSKKFCKDLKKSLWYGVRDVVHELNPLSRNDAGSQDSSLRPGEFWANHDIGFEVRRGECLGLIGRNGAGKTTLLKMLNGLIKPDTGRIELRGRVGAMIALGAGFSPILSGRENIYIIGSLLGIASREISEKLDDIIDFAEIREFIDMPVQSYSSGMQVRLGFAVATALDPDVLILDEVLAVGDAAFRAKCYSRILSVRKRAAVIFVSHSMEQVGRICDSALVLNKGKTSYLGDVEAGIQEYERLNEFGNDKESAFLNLKPPITRFTAEVLSEKVESCSAAALKMIIHASEKISDFRIRINFFSASGAIAAQINESSRDYGHQIDRGETVFSIRIDSLPLRAGRYPLGLHLIDSKGDFIVWSYKEFFLLVTGGNLGSRVECQLPVGEWTLDRSLREVSSM